MSWDRKQYMELFGNLEHASTEDKARTLLEHFLSLPNFTSGKILISHADPYDFYLEGQKIVLGANEARLNISREELPALKTYFINRGCSIFIEGKDLVVSWKNKKM